MGPILEDATTHQRRYTLTKTSTDRSVPWLWLVSSRNQPEAWAEARQLCFHAIWQLIRCQIKPQGVEKSTLAKQIQQQLNNA